MDGVSSAVAAAAGGVAPASGRAGKPLSARSMKVLKMCAGNPPPVAWRIEALSSLPIHTPQIMSALKPTNQASWKSCVVPVLPALGRSPRRAALPVPLDTVSTINPVISAASRGAMTRAGPELLRSHSTFPSTVLMRRMPNAIALSPPLANGT